MPKPNKIRSIVQKFDRLPAPARRKAVSMFFGTAIRFAGTSSVKIEELTTQKSVLTIRNKKKVQNHIGSVHAAAMALLAESATGFLVGMNVPDDKIPVIKSMHIDYVKRATGDLRAVATLPQEDIERMLTTDKGDVTVPVTVTDQKGIEPIKATMIWAWTPKRR